MGEILVECSKCAVEMKYSIFKIHVCPGHKVGDLDELLELIDEIIGIEDIEG